jgi:hypothetical protein
MSIPDNGQGTVEPETGHGQEGYPQKLPMAEPRSMTT